MGIAKAAEALGGACRMCRRAGARTPRTEPPPDRRRPPAATVPPAARGHRVRSAVAGRSNEPARRLEGEQRRRAKDRDAEQQEQGDQRARPTGVGGLPDRRGRVDPGGCRCAAPRGLVVRAGVRPGGDRAESTRRAAGAAAGTGAAAGRPACGRRRRSGRRCGRARRRARGRVRGDCRVGRRRRVGLGGSRRFRRRRCRRRRRTGVDDRRRADDDRRDRRKDRHRSRTADRNVARCRSGGSTSGTERHRGCGQRREHCRPRRAPPATPARTMPTPMRAAGRGARRPVPPTLRHRPRPPEGGRTGPSRGSDGRRGHRCRGHGRSGRGSRGSGGRVGHRDSCAGAEPHAPRCHR